MELTDLEICKRIAEIEGKDIRVLENGRLLVINKGWETSPIYQDFKPYNPLTDNALCFQLMVKYKIILITVHEEYGTGPIVGYNAFYKSLVDKIYLEELNPNKAICLAIIEANN